MKHSFLLALLVASLVAAAALPAAAHHSFAAFDITSQKTVSGTVRQVDWTNPHIWLWIDVPNDKGGSDTYGFEGMSPNFLARRGWSRTTLKTGDKITVSYRPMKDGSPAAIWVEAVRDDGKRFDPREGFKVK